MSGYRLPDGVPPDNQQTETKASFVAPETATPGFSRERQPLTSRPGAAPAAAKAAPMQTAPLTRQLGRVPMALAAVTLLVAVISVAGLVMNQNRLPLCSEQPDWNQYNCIPG